MHYLINWKKIKAKQKKKAVETLNRYIEHVMRKDPDKFIDTIKEDLRNREFMNKRADQFSQDDEFHDVMDEFSNEDIGRILDGMKVDDSY